MSYCGSSLPPFIRTRLPEPKSIPAKSSFGRQAWRCRSAKNRNSRFTLTLEQAVRQITYDTATCWGLHDRGLLRKGMNADVVIFDPQTVAPGMPEVVHDLPAGAKRLRQFAEGISHTIVNGEVVLAHNEPTGALPGELIRC